MPWEEVFETLCRVKASSRARFRIIDTVFVGKPSSWVSTASDGARKRVKLMADEHSAAIRTSFLRQAGAEKRPGSGRRPGSGGAGLGKSPRRSNTFRNVAVAWVGPPHARERRDLNERDLNAMIDGIGSPGFNFAKVRQVRGELVALQPFVMPRLPGTVYHTVLVRHDGVPSVFARRVRLDVSSAAPEPLPASEHDLDDALVVCTNFIARALGDVARLGLEFVVDAHRELWLARVLDHQRGGDADRGDGGGGAGGGARVGALPTPLSHATKAVAPGDAGDDAVVDDLRQQLRRAHRSEIDIAEALKVRTQWAADSAERLKAALQDANGAELLGCELSAERDAAAVMQRELDGASAQLAAGEVEHARAVGALQAQLAAMVRSVHAHEDHVGAARATLREVQADAHLARKVATSARKNAALEAKAAASAGRRLVDTEAALDSMRSAFASCELERANARGGSASVRDAVAVEAARAARAEAKHEQSAALQASAMRALQQQLRDVMRNAARDAERSAQRKIAVAQQVAKDATALAKRERAAAKRAAAALCMVKDEHAELVRVQAVEAAAAAEATRRAAAAGATDGATESAAANAPFAATVHTSSAATTASFAAAAAMSAAMSATMAAFEAHDARAAEMRTAYRETLQTARGDAARAKAEQRIGAKRTEEAARKHAIEVALAKQSVVEEHVDEQRALRQTVSMIETAADTTIKKMQRSHRKTQRAAAVEIGELRSLLDAERAEREAAAAALREVTRRAAAAEARAAELRADARSGEAAQRAPAPIPTEEEVEASMRVEEME